MERMSRKMTKLSSNIGHFVDKSMFMTPFVFLERNQRRVPGQVSKEARERTRGLVISGNEHKKAKRQSTFLSASLPLFSPLIHR